MKYFCLLAALGSAQMIPFNQPLPILTSPVVQVKAGAELHYQLANFRNVTCQATLSFHNVTFLPMSACATPENCAGDQVAKIKIPISAPNGAATLEWQCSGTNGIAVDLIAISGGTGDWDQFMVDSEAMHVNVLCPAHDVTNSNGTSRNTTCL